MSQSNLFNSGKKETVTMGQYGPDDGIDRSEYEEYRPGDLEAEMTFQGKIFMGSAYEFDKSKYGDGQKGKEYKADLAVFNDENQETLKVNIKLKDLTDNLIAWEKSKAYDIIDSLEELNQPGSGLGFHTDTKSKELNKYSMSFKELQEYINGLGIVTVTICDRSVKGNIYQNIRITQIGG
jgi:hypothetical protein